MNNITSSLTNLSQEFKQYLNLKVALVSLNLSRRFSQLFSLLLSAIIFVGLFSVILLMLTFAFVYWYGSEVGTIYHGFLIAGLFYMIVAFMVYAFRKQLFIDPMIRLLNDKIADGLNEEGMFAEINNSRDLKLQTDLLHLKIVQSESQIQKQFTEFSQSLNPLNMLKSVLGSSVSSAAITMAILEAVISWLRKRSSPSGNKDSGSDG